MVETSDDRVIWKLESNGKYSTKAAYSGLSTDNVVLDPLLCRAIWCKGTPTKVNFLVWRLMLDRLPTKRNLVKRNFFDSDQAMCVLCDLAIEDADHVFLPCSVVHKAWMRCCKWLGVLWVNPGFIKDMYFQWVFLRNNSGFLAWWSTLFKVVVWAIWWMRNLIVFQGKCWNEEDLFDCIQGRSFAWIKAFKTELRFSFRDWCCDPVFCFKELENV
ncbi:hypothetical protein REPUB_Repub16aG0092000 [Reevesia pubescens]